MRVRGAAAAQRVPARGSRPRSSCPRAARGRASMCVRGTRLTAQRRVGGEIVLRERARGEGERRDDEGLGHL